MSNKTAKHIMSTSFSVGALIGSIIGVIVVNILLGILTGICYVTVILIPLGILFAFMAAANTITEIFVVIGMIRSKAHLTEEGVYGKKSFFGSFNVSFDSVVALQRQKKNLTVVALNEKGKKKNYNITAVKNAKEFDQAFQQAWVTYRADAAAKAAEEAPAAE